MKVLHQFIEQDEFKSWYWRLEDLWLPVLTGINLDVRKEQGKLILTADPVYMPLVRLTRTPKSLIVDWYAWKEYTNTFVFMLHPPFFLHSAGETEEYEEI